MSDLRPPVRVRALEARPLNIPLEHPFVIASGAIEQVENVAVRLELEDGSVGWGEIPSLPPVTSHDQQAAIAEVRRVAALLGGRDATAWRAIARQLERDLPAAPSVRAGIEMALLDALTRHWNVPLYQFFGGAGDCVTTDITIPINSEDETRRLAASYRDRGFDVIKVKVGHDAEADRTRIEALRSEHAGSVLVLDANEGFDADEAVDVIRQLVRRGAAPALFEQPVARDDWSGLRRVGEEGHVLVAADESCRTPADALRIAGEGLAGVLNIKLAKSGVIGALEIAAIGRAAGLGLMIGGMVESRIAMGFAAHFAAGLGGFDWIDLDTPLLMAEDPVRGGYLAEGPIYRLDGVQAGHGGELD